MRAAFRRVGGAAVGALLAVGVLAAPAHADPASLSGTITAADTGNPLAGCVDVYGASDYSWAGSACADATGQWTVDGLQSGVGYKVQAQSSEGMYLSEWAQDAQDFGAATSYTAPAVVDIALEPGARLEGTLTKADGSPAAWANVAAVVPTTRADVGWGWADETGHWSMLVPAGDYKVRFDAWPSTQWAFGKESFDTADTVAAPVGETTTVNDQLLPQGVVAGAVRSDATGDPIEGACVQVFSASATADPSMSAGSACTDAAGSYSIDISTPGPYVAEFSDPQGRYAGEYTGDVSERADATSFEVARGATTTVSASLATGAVITGLAVDAKTDEPVADACPSAYVGNAGEWVRWQVTECSGSDGRFTVRGLQAGSFALHLGTGWHATHASTWAFKADSQVTADLITVSTGEEKAIRNVKLDPSGTVSGRVTDQYGQPVAGAWVNLDGFYPGRAGPGEGQNTARTDADGRYTIFGVPPGDYKPFVYADYAGDLAPEWAGDSTTSAAAATIKVKSLKTTPFDAQLVPAARITGSVVTADGQPTTDYWVGQIFTTSGDYIGDFDVYNGNTFTSTALPAGDFTLKLESFKEDGTKQVVWYDAATSQDSATVVSLNPGEQTEITVHLP